MRRPDEANNSQHHSRVRGVAPAVVQAARQNRNALTSAEQTLWTALRGKQVDGLRFRSQHPVGRFILDFYCASHKIAIELDGSSHDGREEIDADRTRILKSHGCTVLRFANDLVSADLPAVLQTIRDIAATIHPSTSSNPPPTALSD